MLHEEVTPQGAGRHLDFIREGRYDGYHVEDMRWELDVRCPDCRWTGGDVYEQPEVERYDDVLLAAAGDLTEELDRITRENMAEHLERFRAALDADAITPFDF